MTIKERIAYLKGVATGLDVDDREDGELFKSIIDTLGDIADELEELNENALDIGEELDAISDDLADVEEYLFEDEFDIDDDDFDFDAYDFADDDFDGDDDDDFYGETRGCNFCGSTGATFTIDINCPGCDKEIDLDENDIANESVTCPFCGELIELEIDEVYFDEEDADNDGADLAAIDGATEEEVHSDDNH